MSGPQFADETTDATTKIMSDCMSNLNNMLPGFGKVLLVFGQDDPSICNYISNCDREKMIIALRDTADRIEKNT